MVLKWIKRIFTGWLKETIRDFGQPARPVLFSPQQIVLSFCFSTSLCFLQHSVRATFAGWTEPDVSTRSTFVWSLAQNGLIKAERPENTELFISQQDFSCQIFSVYALSSSTFPPCRWLFSHPHYTCLCLMFIFSILLNVSLLCYDFCSFNLGLICVDKMPSNAAVNFFDYPWLSSWGQISSALHNLTDPNTCYCCAVGCSAITRWSV